MSRNSCRFLLKICSVSVLLTLFLPSLVQAQELGQRVRAKKYPLALNAPPSWDVFTEGQDFSELLFLQTPEGAPYEASISVSAYGAPPKWNDLIKRKNYELLVWDGAPVLVNQALKVRGARAHKWVYEARDEQGLQKLFYQLYVILPGQVSVKRLLVMQGSAPVERSLEAQTLFNAVARSLAWGLAAQQ